jgi:hypothetical protein
MLVLPFTSHMADEILVEYAGTNIDLDGQYKITSHPHMNAFGELCGKPKKNKRKTKFTEDDLMSFKQLGYAVCHNKLDKYGKKVYIHHNKRTFKEKKQ